MTTLPITPSNVITIIPFLSPTHLDIFEAPLSKEFHLGTVHGFFGGAQVLHPFCWHRTFQFRMQRRSRRLFVSTCTTTTSRVSSCGGIRRVMGRRANPGRILVGSFLPGTGQSCVFCPLLALFVDSYTPSHRLPSFSIVIAPCCFHASHW